MCVCTTRYITGKLASFNSMEGHTTLLEICDHHGWCISHRD
nr:MAG TPA: hypothetical protein [Bacteriophage sp.]